MNAISGSSFHHALGNSLAQSPPTAQQKVPVSTQTVAEPLPNSIQRADAVHRSEAPVRSEATASPSSGEETKSRPASGSSERASKIDIYA